MVGVCTHRGGWKGFLSGGGCWVLDDTRCLACLSFHFCRVLDGQRGRWACLAGGLVGLDAMIGHLLWGQDPSFSIGTLRPGGEKSWVGGWEGQSTPASFLVLEARTSMQAPRPLFLCSQGGEEQDTAC